jgi:hypothetical protein
MYGFNRKRCQNPTFKTVSYFLHSFSTFVAAFILPTLLMKNLLFCLLGAVLIVSCQQSGTKSNAPTNETPQSEAFDFNPEKLKIANDRAKNLQQDMLRFADDIKAAYATTDEKQKPELDNLLAQLNDGLEKQAALVKNLEMANAQGVAPKSDAIDSDMGQGGLSPEQLADDIKTIDIFTKEIGDLKTQFETLKKNANK